eukprot:9840865-Prorocentrum_lima.AAC.1
MLQLAKYLLLQHPDDELAILRACGNDVFAFRGPLHPRDRPFTCRNDAAARKSMRVSLRQRSSLKTRVAEVRTCTALGRPRRRRTR